MEDKESRLVVVVGVLLSLILYVLCILHSYGVMYVYSNSSVMVYVCTYIHVVWKLQVNPAAT